MIRSLEKFLPSVSASPPLAPSKTGECSDCDSNATIPAQKLSNTASVSCKTLNGYDPQSLFKVYEDEDDWEFAEVEKGEDEDDVEASARCLKEAIAVPKLLQFTLPLPSEAPLSITVGSDKSHSGLGLRGEIAGCLDEDIGQSSACDWLEPPPISGAFAMEESQRRIGGEGVMLEAFHQFQQNPQVQEMVVALAADERLWRAVLANKKIQEFRFGNGEGDFEVGVAQDFNSVTSSVILLSRNAVRKLKEGIWDQIRGIIDVVDKKVQAETRQLMIEVMLRAFIVMIVFSLTLVAFLCLLPLQASLE